MTKRKKAEKRNELKPTTTKVVKEKNDCPREKKRGNSSLTTKKSAPLCKLRTVWLFFCAVRIVWTLYGQTGYIHPDEFFQAPEVVAGDVFSFQVTKSWEFTSESPIRSMIMPFLTVGIPFYVLRDLSGLSLQNGGPNLVTSASVLFASRFSFCLMSFLVDWFLWKISIVSNLSCYSVLTAFGSSYIALVFYTRSLSNSLEAIFFSALLYLVISTKVVIKNVSNSSPAQNETKRTSKFPTISAEGAVPISIVTAFGFFNRPTFLAFAFVPLLYWLLRSCFPLCRQSALVLVWRAASLVPGTLVASAVCIAFDSVYYGRLSLEELGEALQRPTYLSIVFGRLVVTPINFISYNLDPTNLSSHGQHPFYTHLFNSFLLYGVVGVLVVTSLIHRLYFSVKSSSPHSQTDLLTASYLFPLFVLSLFAHQEPRFLIPLLAPLCLLHSDLVFGSRASRLLAVTWFLWSVAGALLFGVLHQGGVVPSLASLSRLTREGQLRCPARVVYYKTYMPPRHLLALPSDVPKHGEDEDCTHLEVVDLKGCAPEILMDEIRRSRDEDVGELVLITPTEIARRVLCDNRVGFLVLDTIFPHFSMETPPGFDIFSTEGEWRGCFADDDTNLAQSVFDKFKFFLSLSVIKIDKFSLDMNLSS